MCKCKLLFIEIKDKSTHCKSCINTRKCLSCNQSFILKKAHHTNCESCYKLINHNCIFEDKIYVYKCEVDYCSNNATIIHDNMYYCTSHNKKFII